MAESYSIISPDAADSDAADRARWYYAPFYYANVKFASQLCREFAAAESLNHGLSAHLHKAHDCLQLIVEHNSHIKAPPQCRDGAPEALDYEISFSEDVDLAVFYS